MRSILASIYIFSSAAVFAQHPLDQVRLPYEFLDSTFINAAQPMTNDKIHSIVCFGSEEGTKLAYRTSDKRKWIAFLLPFSDPVVSIRTVNLDGRGKAEIIVQGNVRSYGSGGGTANSELIIITRDSVPVQIFDAINSCSMEAFGRNGVKPFVKSYTRSIRITNNEIIVSGLNRKKFPYPDCDITNLNSGTYVMRKGRIKRRSRYTNK